MTVEVFKTNVNDPDHAKLLIDQIHATFLDYTANFDLEDCDKILRVKSAEEPIQVLSLVVLIKNFGFDAEVLSDEQPVNNIFEL
jgi:hypothetical protein